ncbi:MAG: signal recognition particle protein [Crocinitomicaceae bacterium]|nr:signal recognition particle protein [Crocinitomicaceae bacterium]|tara:strand:+ start:1302 stop:2627 length:1326 start_codon:yes stop_codon:yes gene_type:complete
MFENLQERFERAFKVLKGHGQITEVNVGDTLKEVRKALLDADVDYKTAKDFIKRVKEKALGKHVLTALKPGQLLVKITQEELTELMGKAAADFDLKGNPSVVLLAGLQGAGKTTHAGKLAKLITSKGKKVLLVACDVYRPAAIEQLKVVGESVDVEVYTEDDMKDPVGIASRGIDHAKKNGFTSVIVDTAGRLAVDEEMMDEIEAVSKSIKPQETLFVVDAMTGADAVNTAKAFNDRLDFTGVVLTKLDGDARGGAALSIYSKVGKPIKFVGTGEKMDALETFHPNRMAERILGMGDVVTLVERAQKVVDEKEAKLLEEKIRKNKFDLEDFLGQIQQIKKMGNVKDLLSMVPGMGKALKGVDIDDDAFVQVEAIIRSMTPKERSNPKTLDSSRKKRIAKGSGTQLEDVNKLLKQFEDMRKVMSMMNKGGRGRMQLPGLGRR